MYLRIGGRLREFNEADAQISYEPQYDGAHRVIKVREVWDITGTVVQQTDATQSGMTAKLRILEKDFSQDSPDLVFLEDNGSTPTNLRLLASECFWGPELRNFSYPSNGSKVFTTGVPYTARMEGERRGSGGGVLEFREELIDEGVGGWERVHVGGAINAPEEQIGRQYAPYRYRQQGTALGLFGYPKVPPPIWPSKLKRGNNPATLVSPEIIGRIDQRFRVNWTYVYESNVPLRGIPHRFTTS